MTQNLDIPPRTIKRRILNILFTAFAVLAGFVVLLYFIVFPVIGLVTGHLFLVAREGESVWIEGPLARIISAGILFVVGLVIYRGWRMNRNTSLADKLPIWQWK